MDYALMVSKLNQANCKFLLTRNFKTLEATQEAVNKHHKAVAEGRQRKIILMAIQNEVLPDYTILVCKDYPFEKEVEQFGFFPVRKDRANWIPIQYRNRKGEEHLESRDGDYQHTTNYNFLHIDEVKEYIKLAEKQEQLNLIYK